MTHKPIRRALALFLSCQPILWVNNAVLAQSLDGSATRRPPGFPSASGGSNSSPFPEENALGLPGDPFSSQGALGSPGSATGAPGGAFGQEGQALEPLQAPGRGAPETSPDKLDALLSGKIPPVDGPLDPSTYLCGPGDVFELNYWGLQNFKLRVTVDMEGRAFVPKLGFFAAAGKSLADVRGMMRSAVARYYPRLGFDVGLAEPRTFVVQLVDAVPRPGSKVARAVDRVATVIAREGGLGPRASRRRIEIHRRGGAVLQADLLQFAITGDVKYNPYLVDGDVVHVPFEEVSATITGAVNRPGRYELTDTRDLAELVRVAGGLSASVTRDLPVSVVRRMPDERHVQQLVPYPADGALPTLAVEREDSIRIPDAAELQRSVFVVGALSGVPAPLTANTGVKLDESTATRRLPYAAGDTVRTLLDRVNGVGPLADLDRSYIVRGGQSVPVDLARLVQLRDLTADVALELGDTLVIPFRQRNVTVQGAVFTPGSFPYNPSFGVEQYLALAGGRNRFAQSLGSTRIITPEGKTTEYSPSLKVEPGSSVVVPERSFSRPEVVQIVLGIASVLVSGVAVMLAARK